MPVRTLRAVCEIGTAALIVQNQPSAFEGDVGALNVEISFVENGKECDVSAYKTEMHLFYASSDEMTDSVEMSVEGSTAKGAFDEALTAKSGCPLLVVRILDPYTGAILTACAAPVSIRRTLGSKVITTRPPTPSEVVYIGRAPYISAETGCWVVFDSAQGTFVDTGVKAKGEDGENGTDGAPGKDFSVKGTFDTLDLLKAGVPAPSQGDFYNVGTESPYSLYMWDDASADWLYQGQIGAIPGPEGPKGNDGFSPTVTVEDIENGHRVTIQDALKTHVFDVLNGKDGADGKDAETYDQSLNTTDDVTFNSVTASTITANVVYGAVFME